MTVWNGNYGFFDYKYNIEGYSGQDYDGAGRTIFLVFSIVAILALLIIFRNAKHRNVARYLTVVAIALPILEITKIVWESRWDIRTGRGFNWEGLLPLYTCSMFMYALILWRFSKGKLRRAALAWLATIGFVGGVSNLIFLRGLKWYPFFTFGAMYSMTFHFVMTFTALFIVVTGFIRFEWLDVLWAFALHAAFSAVVIPIDYIFHWDYMQYYEAGGVPLFEDLAERCADAGARFLCVPLMLAAYFVLDSFLSALYVGFGKLKDLAAERRNKKRSDG